MYSILTMNFTTKETPFEFLFVYIPKDKLNAVISNEISIETKYDKNIVGSREAIKRLTYIKQGER